MLLNFPCIYSPSTKVNDLLDTKKQDLPIRQDIDGNIFIPTLTEVQYG